MKIKGNSYRFVLKYLVVFFICLVLSNANINGLSPFLIAFFFASIYVGLDYKLMATFTLCCALALEPTLESLLLNLTAVAVGILSYFIFRWSKRSMPLYAIFISYLIGLATYIYYHFVDFRSLLYFIALGLISLYAFIIVLHVILLRKNCFKLTLNESICFLYALALLGVGLAPVYIFEFL